jgi:FAD/FMN-containing dehydrogenase
MLNDYGCSPRTMQSYSTFSVGGSMSVAAHGITTDVPVSESVQWCKLVDAEGNLRHVQQGDELMRYVCGGYGLFGIVYEIGMTVADNAHLTMDMMQTDLYRFPQLFDAVLSDPDVHIKLSRLDVTDLDNITVFVFRRAGIAGVRTVSALPAKPREMSTKQRLMYKWLAPSMQRVRGLIESALGSAMDWSDANERNLLMYESAQPLAELYSPILDIDDTFVLQEYFVPKSSLVNWVDAARPIYARALASDRLTLLNTTIRKPPCRTLLALRCSTPPSLTLL